MTTTKKLFVAEVEPMLKMLYAMRGGTNLENKPPSKQVTMDTMKQVYDRDRMHFLGLILPFPVDVVELRPSRVHGRGVFAKRKISKNEIVTFYPGDMVSWHANGRHPDDPTYVGIGMDHEGDGLTMSAKVNYEKDRDCYNDYSTMVVPFYDVIGTPENDKNPAYLGHFINDAAKANKDERSIPIYNAISQAKANVKFMSIHDLHVAIIATRDIEADEEIYIPYAAKYWMMRSK
jgi:hypothetical protein